PGWQALFLRILNVLDEKRRLWKETVLMPKLMLFADFAETFLPLPLMRQRIGIRSPELLHHLALRDERTFCLGIAMNVVKVLQHQLRSGHHSVLAELLVEPVRRVVERAPALGGGLAPERRVCVKARQVPEADTNLAHGLGLVAQDVAEQRLEHG